MAAQAQIHLPGPLEMTHYMEMDGPRLAGLKLLILEALLHVRKVVMTPLTRVKAMTMSTGVLATTRLTPARELMKFMAVWAMIRLPRVPVPTPSGEGLQITTLA